MISIDNVSYKIKEKYILKNININISKNEKVLIYGSSGSGKTTLFNLLSKIIEPSEGKIKINDKDLCLLSKKQVQKYRSDFLSIIMQHDDLFESLSVYENLAMHYHDDDIINHLKKANLYDLRNRIVKTLSGGERQKIAILKECLKGNEVLLCDEITSSLDFKSASILLEFILDLFKDKTVIFISHDLNLFTNKVNKIINIEKSKLISCKVVNLNLPQTSNKNKTRTKKGFELTFIQAKKNFSTINFMFFLLTILCFYVVIYFNDIFSFIAKKSYQQYFNYEVFYIKDNKDLKDNNVDIFIDISNVLSNSTVKINNNSITNVSFQPFINHDTDYHIAINTMFLKQLNISDVNEIKIVNEYFKITFNKIKIINEDNMFTIPLIYFDLFYFNKFKIITDSYVYVSDDYIFDDRFTNNPLYEQKKEDKPYLDSLALNDYLTFDLIFDSIKQIIDSYFLSILIYCFIINILIYVSLIIKEAKKIAIFILKGISIYKLLLMYVIPLIIYFFIFLIISIFLNDLFLPTLLSFFIQFISLVVTFFILTNKSLFKNLKEDMYT